MSHEGSFATVHIRRHVGCETRGRPLGGEKARKAILEIVAPRPEGDDSRQLYALELKCLKTVLEHRTIVLFEYRFSYVHEEVG